jgi:hypothetical protein
MEEVADFPVVVVRSVEEEPAEIGKMRALVSFVLFLVVLSSARRTVAQHDSLAVRGKYAYLPILHEHQETNMCLPTCVAMVFSYFETAKDPRTIKRLSNARRDIHSGTRFEEVQEAVKGYGYTWDFWNWPDDSIGFSNALLAVETSLDDGKPVILEFNNLKTDHPKTTHALLAFGYDSESGQLFILDPAARAPGKRYIPYDKLRELWDVEGKRYALFTARIGDLPDGHPKK